MTFCGHSRQAAKIEKGYVVFENRSIPAQASTEWRFQFFPKVAGKLAAMAFAFNVQRVQWWSLK